MDGTERQAAVAFFDIGDTLASVRLDPGGTGIDEMVVLPGVLEVLARLRGAQVRLGVLSNRGMVPADVVDSALADAGLAEFLDPALVLYGTKDSVRLFERAALLARSDAARAPRRLLFVGDDSTERAFARAADFTVCPHPVLAPGMLLDPSPLRFLRVRTPPAAATDWRVALRGYPVVPLHLGGPDPEMYAIADTRTALELDDTGFWVDRLGGDDEPLTCDLYLLRDDDRVGAGLGAGAGSAAALFAAGPAAGRVLASTPDGLVVAVPAGRSVESLHLGTPRHGHNLKLTALPALLDPAAIGGLREPALGEAVGSGRAEPTLNPQEREVISQEITPDGIGRDVDRYSGARPIEGSSSIASRHIHHLDNARAVEALVADLQALGERLHVRTHRFSHEGRPHDNVEAVLPARGLPHVVLITAHLDSTAARGPGYRPDRDPAPGADDDGSGTAAVLSAARAMLALDARLELPRREVRFVLFNAEEHGLVGSRAYAREQAIRGADILAVLQLDMVGFDSAGARTFELHAGFRPSTAIQKRSLELAELIAAQVPVISPTLPSPQIYPSNGGTDPAEARSDHYSFQLNGYPACLASEDFFAGPTSNAPQPDPNPHYHSATDTAIDTGYAADILRTVAAAAWLTSTR